ncbi:hypothetical protein [Priestia megaterium]|nr:hypothetical protein [Priestia megaterium]
MIGGQGESSPTARGKRILARKSTAVEQEVQLMYLICSFLGCIDFVMA